MIFFINRYFHLNLFFFRGESEILMDENMKTDFKLCSNCVIDSLQLKFNQLSHNLWENYFFCFTYVCAKAPHFQLLVRETKKYCFLAVSLLS